LGIGWKSTAELLKDPSIRNNDVQFIDRRAAAQSKTKKFQQRINGTSIEVNEPYVNYRAIYLYFDHIVMKVDRDFIQEVIRTYVLDGCGLVGVDDI
jgi:hypothetical protein